MAVKGGALAVAQEVLAIQRAARERDPAPPPEPAHADAPAARAALPQAETSLAPAGHPNRVIEAWKAQRAPAAQG